MDHGLAGQSYLVTGGSSGIGLATARLLLDGHALVTICGRDRQRLSAAQTALDSDRLRAVAADVLDAAAAESVVTTAREHGGRLDGIAACAGMGGHGSLLELAPATIADEIARKVRGLLNTVRPAVAHLAATGGRIVALTAPTALTPDPRRGAVSAGRAVVDNIVSSLALELAPTGIRVNAVGVGLIDTGRQQVRHAERGIGTYGDWLQREAEQRSIPLRRPGTAREVALAACWLLSPLSSYTTGAVIDVTGGQRSR